MALNLTAIQGIVDAIKGEAKIPQPSHSNLARLIGMLADLVIEHLKSTAPDPENKPVPAPQSVLAEAAEGVNIPPVVKSKRRKKAKEK